MAATAESEDARTLIEGLTPTERGCVVALATAPPQWVKSSRVTARIAATPGLVCESDPADREHVERNAGDGDERSAPAPPDHAYATLVRLAQPFFTRYPLVAGQGNFGSPDDDVPAAAHYSEARASVAARTLYDPRTDDFRLPLALLVGRRVPGTHYRLVPHTVEDVVRALRAYLANPEVSPDALVDALVAPDFPCGGVVHRDDARALYLTGRARLRVDAEVEALPAAGPPRPPWAFDSEIKNAETELRHWTVAQCVAVKSLFPGVTRVQWEREKARYKAHRAAWERRWNRLVIWALPLPVAADQARWLRHLAANARSKPAYRAIADCEWARDHQLLLLHPGADPEQIRDLLFRDGVLAQVVDAQWGATPTPLRELLAAWVATRTGHLVGAGLAADANAARTLIDADAMAALAALADTRRTRVAP